MTINLKSSLSTILILAEATPRFVSHEDVQALAKAYRKLQKRMRAANKKLKAYEAQHD